MFVAFLVWLVLSFFIAQGAKDRGKSFGGYLALSLLLSPLVGLIAVLMIHEPEKEG